MISFSDHGWYGDSTSQLCGGSPTSTLSPIPSRTHWYDDSTSHLWRSSPTLYISPIPLRPRCCRQRSRRRHSLTPTPPVQYRNRSMDHLADFISTSSVELSSASSVDLPYHPRPTLRTCESHPTCESQFHASPHPTPIVFVGGAGM